MPGTLAHAQGRDGALLTAYPTDFLVTRKDRAYLICSPLAGLLVLGLLYKRSQPCYSVGPHCLHSFPMTPGSGSCQSRDPQG